MSRQVLRWEVPFDQDVSLPCNWPKAFAATDSGVEFWCEGDPNPDREIAPLTFRVFGTGWDIPQHWQYVGTCARVRGFVWHLYVRTDWVDDL